LVVEEEAHKRENEVNERLAAEAKAKRKAYEEAKWKRKTKLKETQRNPSTPNVGIMNIPPHECTLLMAILGNLIFS